MKKRILTIMCVSALVMATLVGCGNKTDATSTVDGTNTKAVADTVTEAVNEVEDVVEEAEAPHEHTYTEEVTKEPTCLEDGESTFTCECGDTYTEAISATGHDFSNYVSNEDATYTADGTETATCACGETDTRVAEGSMLTYTFEDMEATKYAKSTVNVRSLPNTDGEKLGGLSTNDEVKVTGKCAETGWYRIEYADGIAYVSDSYLVDEKVETQASAPAQNSSELPTFATYAEVKAYAISLGYPIGGATDNGDGTASAYFIEVIQNDTYLSWDYEYEARCIDMTNARWAADDILGCASAYKSNSDFQNIKIAYCPDANYTWEVCKERQHPL